MCRALWGQVTALPKAPAAQSFSDRPAATLALRVAGVVLGRCGAGAPLLGAARVRSWGGHGTQDPPRRCGGPAPWWRRSGGGGTAPCPQGTVVGSAAICFRRQSGGDALRLVVAENMGPWLRASSTSRWKVEGDREEFADAWRRWVEEQSPVGGMLHLPQPPNVPPAAVAKPVPKAGPKPPPKKSLPPPVRQLYQHTVRAAALRRRTSHGASWVKGDQRLPLVPTGWSWSLLVVGRQALPATHLHPRDLLDHLLRDHGSGPAQRDQAMAMLAGIMPRGQAGPFLSAQARSRTLALPTRAYPAGGQGASQLVASSVAGRPVAVFDGGRGGGCVGQWSREIT